MSNGTIRIHEIDTKVIGEVLIALVHKYDDIRISADKLYVEIHYSDNEKKGADNDS